MDVWSRDMPQSSRMRAERRRRQWTQTELAYKAKLSTTDVSKFETGRARPYPKQAARLARALNLQVDQLLDPTPPEE